MRIETVILGGMWEYYTHLDNFRFSMLTDTIGALSKVGTKVVVIGQSPAFVFENPHDMLYGSQLSGKPILNFRPLVRFDESLLNTVRESAKGANFIDPMQYLCNKRW